MHNFMNCLIIRALCSFHCTPGGEAGNYCFSKHIMGLFCSLKLIFNRSVKLSTHGRVFRSPLETKGQNTLNDGKSHENA